MTKSKVKEEEEEQFSIGFILSGVLKQYEDTKKSLASLGILINSGGIIAILTYVQHDLKGQFKYALISFVFSIVFIFAGEFLRVKTYKDTLLQLQASKKKAETINSKEFNELKIFNRLPILYFIDYGSVALGSYGTFFAIKALINI